jgi:hypothetical protein
MHLLQAVVLIHVKQSSMHFVQAKPVSKKYPATQEEHLLAFVKQLTQGILQDAQISAVES